MEDRWVALERTAAGGLWCLLLGAELRPVARGQTPRRPAGTWLRLVDHQTGELISLAEDEYLASQVAEEQARTAEEQARAEAEARRQAEERARAAEERVARLDALLRALEEQRGHDVG